MMITQLKKLAEELQEQIGGEVLTEEDLLSDVDRVWRKISGEVNRRFKEGYATCAFATKAVAEELAPKYEVSVVDGTYKGDPHWFALATVSKKKYIIDLGNNLKYVEKEQIQPEVRAFPSAKYVVDEILTPKEFFAFYPKIEKY